MDNNSKETLEEATRKYLKNCKEAIHDNIMFIQGSNFGAKWQQEQENKKMYSEEEVIRATNWYLDEFLDDALGLNGSEKEQKVKHLKGKGLTKEILNLWFEQFKKR